MTNPLDEARLLDETVRITLLAGETIMSFYRDAYTVTDKSPDNPVTDADFAADTLLKRELLALLPQAGWLSEETVDDRERLGKPLTWVVDPLDGTKEFVLGVPEFAISVALVENERPILGVIYNPATEELFHGRRGQPVMYQNNRVHASQRQDMVDAAVDASRSEIKRGEFAPFADLVTLKVVGSIAYKLARVAAGHADATWSRGPKNEWDICAGDFLVHAAGGFFVNLDDEEMRYNQPKTLVNGLIAGGSGLHDEIIATLAPHRQTAREN